MISLYENATHIIATGEERELKVLVQAFRYHPDQYFRSPKWERYQATGGEEGWDGYLYPLRIVSDGVARILRGYREGLLHACEENGLETDTRKLLKRPFAQLALEDVRPDLIKADFQLDDYQRRSIQQLLVYGNGVIQTTVGGGKTATFAGCAAMIKERFPNARFIYMTPTERLVRQSYSEMKKFLPSWDISQFGGGRRNDTGQDMVIATIAILNRNFRTLSASGWFDSFMAIFFDEVHHAGSESAQRVLLAIPSYFRLGASDSRKVDDPVRYNTIRGAFGDMLSETSASPLILAGRLVRPHHYLVDVPTWQGRYEHTPFTPDIGTEAVVLQDNRWVKGTYAGPVHELDDEGEVVYRIKRSLDENKEWLDEKVPVVVSGLHTITLDGVDQEIESRWCLLERLYDRGVVRFAERNKLVIDWAVHFSKQDFTTLVVARRTLHIFILEALAKAAHPEPDKVQILFGSATSRQRDDMFEWFRDVPGAILISPLVQEGVNIPRIRAAVVADYISSWELGNQITGRVIRSCEGKTRADIIWFVERQHSTLRRNSVNVYSQLEKIHGYTFYHPCAGPESIQQALEFRTRDLNTG